MNTRNSTGKITGPREMKLELTRSCPLSCLHCSANAGPSQEPSIPFAAAKQLINDFALMEGEFIVLTGGEPLDYPQVGELAAFGKGLGLQTILYTTGLAHGPRVAVDRLAAIAPYVDTFVFCLNASSPNVHDRITQVAGSYHSTRDAIEFLMSRQKAVCIHHVPLLANQGELLPLCENAIEMGLDSLKLLRFVPQGRGARNSNDLLLDSIEMNRLGSEITLAQRMFPSFRIDLGAPFSMFHAKKCTLCGASSRTISVGADLDCYPCDGFKFASGGAFREPLRGRSLQRFWTESAVISQVRDDLTRLIGQGSNGCLAQKLLAGGSLSGCGEDPFVTHVSQFGSKAVA